MVDELVFVTWVLKSCRVLNERWSRTQKIPKFWNHMLEFWHNITYLGIKLFCCKAMLCEGTVVCVKVVLACTVSEDLCCVM